MYHGITFTCDDVEKKTWEDWCLIPEEQIVITPPTQKTNYIDIPGASGSLDMSTVLTGYPLFSDRTGSISFLIMNNQQTNLPECNPKKIHRLSEDIMEYLHGKKVKMILDDDYLYYYEGRLTVGEVTPDPNWSKISFNYTLNPYKWSIFNSVDSNWLWDPFSFDTGVIYRGLYYERELKQGDNIFNFNSRLCGTAPTQIGFRVYRKNSPTVYAGHTVKIYDNLLSNNKSYTIYTNKTSPYYKPSDWVSHGQNWDLRVYTSYTDTCIDIEFRPGRL